MIATQRGQSFNAVEICCGSWNRAVWSFDFFRCYLLFFHFFKEIKLTRKL